MIQFRCRFRFWAAAIVLIVTLAACGGPDTPAPTAAVQARTLVPARATAVPSPTATWTPSPTPLPTFTPTITPTPTQTPSPTPHPLAAYTIEGLRAREYPGAPFACAG